jgi:carboxymethylenebutenolidase
VVYYATRACDFTASHSAVQVHLAESDRFVTPAGVVALERALGRAGRPYETHAYLGTGHWFAERDRIDAFRPDAAQLAWSRTVAFLDAHLPAGTR